MDISANCHEVAFRVVVDNVLSTSEIIEGVSIGMEMKG